MVDDGSTDGTGPVLDRMAAADTRLLALHRPAGYGLPGKPGALNYALGQAGGEIIAVFDADHRPHPEVLRRLVPHFADPAVGSVQGRCVIRNAAAAPITRLVAIDYLGGFFVNEFGRQSVFGLPANGGANCAVRASGQVAITEVNPRFSGGLPLSLAAGADLVGEYLRAVTGLPVRPERLAYRPGVRMTRYHEEVFSLA